MQEKIQHLLSLYHPRTMKEKGIVWSMFLLLVTFIVLTGFLGWFWSLQPEGFDVKSVAVERINDESKPLVTGAVFTSSLMKIGETLLDKRGGYLSNDVMPPGFWLDNMPNWEFGALVMLRDGSAALRNHLSRSQSQSIEDKHLARAEPQFNFQNDSWIFPATESEYRDGLLEMRQYFQALNNPSQQQAQFYARADNLRQYLEIVEKRLGSLSQRLSASVGQVRVNTDLAGNNEGRQATKTPDVVSVKTPWLELDNVFYEARGTTWALRALLQSVEIDFENVLKKKNALISLRQIIRELNETQQSTFSPVILNGGGFGVFSNYSLTMANYIARATAGIIDLRNLLEQG